MATAAGNDERSGGVDFGSTRPMAQRAETNQFVSKSSPVVLVIEDEAQIRRFLRHALSSEGYTSLEATNAKDGMTEAATYPPDIILLDLGLPDTDGLEVIRNIRSWSAAPIIVISARGQESDKVAALDLGANDYLTKPFSVPELMARIRALLRVSALSGEQKVSIFKVGDLHVDLDRRIVKCHEKEVHLSVIEYKLLTLLVKHAGKVLTHRQILSEVWGSNNTDEDNSLRVYVHQLRHKIEDDPARPRYLITEIGVGYRMRAN
jgi:two-component system KDP operon response regulator KdpE